MKIEITVAIVLLASGIAASHLFARKAPTSMPGVNLAQAASSNQNAVTSAASTQDSPRIASRVTTSPDNEKNFNSIIKQAAVALNNSPPLKARLRYKIELFDEQISGPGRYYQKGQGTRLSRMQFEFGFNQSAVQIHQFCDGDMLYTLSIAGDKKNLEFVDLRKLDELQQDVSSASRVGSWLSVGSLTGLMDQLSEHFVFTEIQDGELDSIPVTVCTGQWDCSALARLLEGQPEAAAAREDGTVDWQHLPKHMPHQVSLTIGRDEKFPYFPYRIVFRQFEQIDGEIVAKDVSVLELFEVKQALDLGDEMFTIPGMETPPIDSTEFYRKRILQFTR